MFVTVFLLLLAVTNAFLLDSISNKKVQVLLTTGDQSKRLSHEPDLHPTSANSGTIRIDRSKKYQRMEGFGAAISNSAAYVIYHSPKRHEIMRELFSPTDGIGGYLLT